MQIFQQTISMNLSAENFGFVAKLFNDQMFQGPPD